MPALLSLPFVEGKERLPSRMRRTCKTSRSGLERGPAGCRADLNVDQRSPLSDWATECIVRKWYSEAIRDEMSILSRRQR